MRHRGKATEHSIGIFAQFVEHREQSPLTILTTLATQAVTLADTLVQ